MDADRKIVLTMPGYGKQTEGAGRGFWRACRNMAGVWNEYQGGSLLAANFNALWCLALNLVHHGQRVDYFAMLHDDVAPDDFWLDALIEELEAKKLDVLGVAVPIKDRRGLTSLALHREGDNWLPLTRLTMREISQLPETFTSADVGHPLLLNTGCWVAKWNQDWCRKVHFEINDRIAFNRAQNKYVCQTEPEDWFFSRQCHELGLAIGATRKVHVEHAGDMKFTNDRPWGEEAFDREFCTKSVLPGAFPWDVKGWLEPEEGAELARLAAGKRVLEIGSYCGRSTVCLARTAAHVTAVDFFGESGDSFYGDYLREFEQSLARHTVTDKVTRRHPDELLTGEFDFAFIDGAHHYEAVAADIEKVLGVLAPGGLIAFHDYKGGIDPGVDRAVDELVADGAELLSLTKTLAVVKPPAAIPLEV